jgi:hypothetical protein
MMAFDLLRIRSKQAKILGGILARRKVPQVPFTGWSCPVGGGDVGARTLVGPSSLRGGRPPAQH